MILEFQQYQLKESLGNIAALGDLRDQQWPLTVFFAHDEQRLERIFGLV